jgi:hypothetical protein
MERAALLVNDRPFRVALAKPNQIFGSMFPLSIATILLMARLWCRFRHQIKRRR